MKTRTDRTRRYLFAILMAVFIFVQPVYAVTNRVIPVPVSAGSAQSILPANVHLSATTLPPDATTVIIDDEDIPLAQGIQRDSAWGVDTGWPLVIFGGIVFIVLSIVMKAQAEKMRK